MIIFYFLNELSRFHILLSANCCIMQSSEYGLYLRQFSKLCEFSFYPKTQDHYYRYILKRMLFPSTLFILNAHTATLFLQDVSCYVLNELKLSQRHMIDCNVRVFVKKKNNNSAHRALGTCIDIRNIYMKINII